MKNSIPHLLFSLILFLIITGCDDQVEITRTYTVMEPVYMSLEEIRTSVTVEESEVFSEIGRIYLYGHFIFVNDPGNGVHVIDNKDPENPEIIKFINIPGNYNISIKGDILYADSYVDLVAIKIDDINHIEIVSRIEDVFSGFNNENTEFFDPEKGVVVGWDQVKTIQVTDKDFNNRYPSYFSFGKNAVAFEGNFADASAISRTFLAQPTIQTGIGGSMARFTIYNDHLYGIDHSHLYVFDISDLENPKKGFQKEVGFGIETIFRINESYLLLSFNRTRLELKPGLSASSANPFQSFNRTRLELKQILAANASRFFWTFNRTRLELKLETIVDEFGEVIPFNRTRLELKLSCKFISLSTTSSFNRTRLELKPTTT